MPDLLSVIAECEGKLLPVMDFVANTKQFSHGWFLEGMSGNIFSLLFSLSDLFLYIFNRLVDLALLVI